VWRWTHDRRRRIARSSCKQAAQTAHLQYSTCQLSVQWGHATRVVDTEQANTYDSDVYGMWRALASACVQSSVIYSWRRAGTASMPHASEYMRVCVCHTLPCTHCGVRHTPPGQSIAE
jgi:hypothetical protein